MAPQFTPDLFRIDVKRLQSKRPIRGLNQVRQLTHGYATAGYEFEIDVQAGEGIGVVGMREPCNREPEVYAVEELPRNFGRQAPFACSAIHSFPVLFATSLTLRRNRLVLRIDHQLSKP